MSGVVVVVAGGDPIDPSMLAGLPTDTVIAADSGLDLAHALGVEPQVVVGDLDSVSAEALTRHAGTVERHPVDKDATDLELALVAAIARRPDRIVVLGGHGGRLDHLVANALVLTAVPAAIDVEWRAGAARVHVIRERGALSASPGSLVSLVAVGGDATGVTTSGLRWPLTDDTLRFGSTRGVSNEFTAEAAVVTVRTGVVLAILPGQS